MPGLNGIELQKALIQRGREEQLVFITGHGNIPMCADVHAESSSLFRVTVIP
jgi:FixJ family two-component response regulator